MDDAQPLHRLLYRSRSALAGSDEAIEARIAALIATASRRNAEAQVTGALLFSASVFLQALEGPRPAVEAVFERIARDLSHFDIEIIEYAAVETRAFGGWSLRRLHADAPIERLLLQIGEPARDGTGAPELAAQAVTLMATLVQTDAARAA